MGTTNAPSENPDGWPLQQQHKTPTADVICSIPQGRCPNHSDGPAAVTNQVTIRTCNQHDSQYGQHIKYHLQWQNWKFARQANCTPRTPKAYPVQPTGHTGRHAIHGGQEGHSLRPRTFNIDASVRNISTIQGNTNSEQYRIKKCISKVIFSIATYIVNNLNILYFP